jgi:hypothetical protein
MVMTLLKIMVWPLLDWNTIKVLWDWILGHNGRSPSISDRDINLSDLKIRG